MAHDLKLFHAYTACTRVTLTALEQVGLPYADQILDMMKGEHKSPQFLAINPQGKVPTLLVDGEVLTENGAILRWLDAEYPQAGLFPAPANDLERARQIADVLWVSSGWHPSVRAVKVPFMWTKGDPAPVRERGTELVTSLTKQLEDRVSGQEWWYGETWSIVDTYLWWAVINAEIGGFDLSPFPGIAGWRARNEAQPALVRALAREEAAFAALQKGA
jgi:glutathione S-transferase